MSQWHTGARENDPEEDTVPRNCSGSGGDRLPSGSSFTDSSRIAHINDSNTEGDIGAMCANMSTTLLQAASTIASTQDVVASGLREGAFLSPKPNRLSTTEVVLSIVSAAQGVAVTFVLLFVEADEWGLRVVRLALWIHRSWFGLSGRPVPEHILAANPDVGRRTTRFFGLLSIATVLAVYVDAHPESVVERVDGDSLSLAFPCALNRCSNPRSPRCLLLPCTLSA